jgi:hypothetical protein
MGSQAEGERKKLGVAHQFGAVMGSQKLNLIVGLSSKTCRRWNFCHPPE